MARIQVLPLTTETVGAVSQTPFLLIIDKCGEDDSGNPESEIYRQLASAEQVGAKLVLVTRGELTVENVDQELHDAAAAAVERALRPARTFEARDAGA